MQESYLKVVNKNYKKQINGDFEDCMIDIRNLNEFAIHVKMMNINITQDTLIEIQKETYQ